MKQLQQFAIIGVGVAALILVIFYAFDDSGRVRKQDREKTSERVNLPEFIGTARRNRLLAAEYLAGRKGDVSRIKNLGRFEPNSNDVLIINNPTHTLPRLAVEQLLDWVSQGGKIVIEARSSGEDDILLEQLEVEAKAMPQETNTVRLPGYKHEIKITSESYLESDSYQSNLSAQLRSQLAVIQHGRGQVILFTSFEPLYTRQLDEADHAKFVSDLSWGAGHAYFMYTIFVPPIADDFWSKGWYIVLAFLLALAIWAWSSSLRIGRILPPAQTERRSLMEHVVASGRFTWKLEQGRIEMLDAVRAATLRELEQHFAGWKSVPEEKQVALVHNLVQQQFTPQQIGTALFAVVPQNLIADAISQLATIRSAI